MQKYHTIINVKYRYDMSLFNIIVKFNEFNRLKALSIKFLSKM